jgi:hypothetical protein
VIRQQVRAFNLPERVGDWLPKLQHWAGLIASGRADDFKETALLPDFLTDIFCGLLGYTGPAASADTFTFSRERHVEVDGKVADAVLGRFQKDKEQFVAVLEGKGARDPLDRPFAGRRMSAVDQAYRYAINLPCDWIIVTSMRETRLYHKGSPQNAYECFETTRLAGEPALLKRFVFLLGAERVVRDHCDCHLYDLLRASETVRRELTNQFYALYADTIREGNSIISDPAGHPKAFDWQAAFPQVFAQGGFDVVVGNPACIRQELLTPFKPWLEVRYEAFHGMADIYVYFYELGVRLLKPGGLLSFIVAIKPLAPTRHTSGHAKSKFYH